MAGDVRGSGSISRQSLVDQPANLFGLLQNGLIRVPIGAVHVRSGADGSISGSIKTTAVE